MNADGFLLAAAARFGIGTILDLRWKVPLGLVTVFASWALRSFGLPHPTTVEPVGGVRSCRTSGSGDSPALEPGENLKTPGELECGELLLPAGEIVFESGEAASGAVNATVRVGDGGPSRLRLSCRPLSLVSMASLGSEDRKINCRDPREAHRRASGVMRANENRLIIMGSVKWIWLIFRHVHTFGLVVRGTARISKKSAEVEP